jgi:hypothetical protein
MSITGPTLGVSSPPISIVGKSWWISLKFSLIDQLRLPRSRKTLRVHRDNLHALGGQMIRIWHEQPHLRKRGILRMPLEAIGDDGGPIVYPPLTEADQRSFDSTCRLLHRFTSLQ